MRASETIAAIATPPGKGGVSIIKMSGDGAKEIAERILSRPSGSNGRKLSLAGRRIHYCKVVGESGATISDAIVLYMKAPRSYTGEDVVEIQSVGGEKVAEEILRAVIAGGAVPAGPGEFTKRAVLSGKIDLAQAEAIIDLIEARTEREIREAASDAGGKFSEKIRSFAEGLETIIAKIAVYFDYPDEEEASEEEILSGIREAKRKAERLSQDFVFRKIDKFGVKIAIVGRANVGKSSLLNALLSEERAIVTERPGTTRDTIEEEMIIGGVRAILVDTAGIRSPKAASEKEGIARTKKKISEADIALIVRDISKEENADDKKIERLAAKKKKIAVYNKIDLLKKDPLKEAKKAAEKSPEKLAREDAVFISAKKKQGLDNLLQAIEKNISSLSEADLENKPSINLRQEMLIRKAAAELAAAETALEKGAGVETVDVIIKQVREYLLEVVGESVSDDAIDSVFERFCIGK
jgi:tRNA modification GTPase